MNEINIISTDARYEALCDIFLKKGYKCRICTPYDIENCDILILPIRSALTEEEFSKIFQVVERSALVFSGEVEKVKKHFKGKVVNYSNDESFVDRNAYITAECAIILAQNILQKAIFESRCAIIGYGRIGRHLTKMLGSLEACIDVFARREESRKSAELNGAEAYKINKLNEGFYDVIFNTVPEKIISKEQSDKISNNTLVLDLASLPGGFEDENFPTRALALPGKMKPISAGRAIFDFVEEYISNERN